MPAPYDVFHTEIRVPDLEAAIEYYGTVFAWQIVRTAPSYALVDAGALPIIGIASDPRLATRVATKVLVDDVEAMTARALELGGEVATPRQETPSSALVGLADPFSNELVFLQLHSDERPAMTADRKNPIAHLEIAVPDIEAAQDYYMALCGWSFWSLVSESGFAVAEEGGLPAGISLYQVGNAGATSYVEVDSIDEALEKVRAAGGRMLVGPSPFPGGGRYSLTEGPDENRIGLYEPPKPS